MKIFLGLFVAMLCLMPIAAVSASLDTQKGDTSRAKIRMVFNSHEVIVEMYDTPATKDFMALLPLALPFSDYASMEKIATLPRKLNTKGTASAREQPGDFAYYAPWGNLAVYYSGFGSDGQLYALGRIISGKDKLASMLTAFNATISRVE